MKKPKDLDSLDRLDPELKHMFGELTFMPCQWCGSTNYDDAVDDPFYLQHNIYFPVTCDECEHPSNRPVRSKTH